MGRKPSAEGSGPGNPIGILGPFSIGFYVLCSHIGELPGGGECLLPSSWGSHHSQMGSELLSRTLHHFLLFQSSKNTKLTWDLTLWQLVYVVFSECPLLPSSSSQDLE